MRTASFLTTAAIVSVILTAVPAGATPYTITDNYIGAAPTHSSYVGRDVIGDTGLFGVSSMTVDFVGGAMHVSISSAYFDNVGQYGTELGDLFVSTNGYSPTTPNRLDNMSNGERWEYAVRLDARGVANLVQLTPSNWATYNAQVLTSNETFGATHPTSSWVYRGGQEVQVQDNLRSIAVGSWTNTGATLDIAIGAGALLGGGSDLGFHWTMTCANDVIEGSVPAPVPEPATLSLITLGLLGLGAFSRRKRA